MIKELKECVVVDCARTPIGKSSWKGLEKPGDAFRICRMVHEMVNRNLDWGIQTLCGGYGVEIATVVKR